MLNQWVRFGLARHPHFLKPAAIADAITTVVSGTARRAPEPDRGLPRSPRGGHDDRLPTSREVSYAVPDDGHGHLAEMRVDPIGLFERVRAECGDIGRFRLADRDVVLVSGAEANEQFFRAPDSTLDQAAAYPFMTPIFGKGVVFDASPEERQQMLKNQALRGDMMRGHAATIEAEINRMVADWGDEGEIDLLDWFAELTIYTTSACLIGKPFREELDSSFAHHYHELERGTDALAYVDPYMDIESFRLRDAAREKLVALVQGIIDKRIARGKVAREDRDLLDVLISIDMTADYITGIFISMMFAGHHTSSGTASWALIELMRHPEVMKDVVAELDDLYADGSGGLLPGAALDPAAGGGAQGDPAAAPAADHPAAGRRRRRSSWPATRSRPAPWSPPRPRVSNRIAEDFPEPGRASTRRATSTRARRTCRTAGPGSRSAPASTAASATRSR